MAVDPASLAFAFVLAFLIVGIHFRVLIGANRNVPTESKRRRANLVFTVWHGVGMAATIVVALLVEPSQNGTRWQIIPLGANQFLAIIWWSRALRAIRDAENAARG